MFGYLNKLLNIGLIASRMDEIYWFKVPKINPSDSYRNTPVIFMSMYKNEV